jgi:hypothetical protein
MALLFSFIMSDFLLIRICKLYMVEDHTAAAMEMSVF